MDDNVLPFPKKPEDWPWPDVRDVIVAAVKRSEGIPETAPEAIAARMKVDALRWIDLAGEISGGVGPLERARLLTFVSEVLVDRLLVEMDRERYCGGSRRA